MSNEVRPPSVFIASSSEALDLAHELQLSLQKEFSVTTWDQGPFGLMMGTFECVRAVADSFDFAIVFLSSDCVTMERGRQLNTPRDNVVFEAGFFVGTLGRERTIIVCCEEDNIDLPTDLQGTTIAKYHRPADGNNQAALNAVVVPIVRLIRARGPRKKADIGPTFFSQSDSTEFISYTETLLWQAKRVVLMGTGLNILQRDPLRHELMSRAARDECNLEIFLADPASPAVENRLVEEELGHIRPPVGRIGLQTRLESLLAERRSLRDPTSISIRLFRHYPTFALLIADEEYFIYPYGFATLGNFSPVVRFSATRTSESKIIQFLEKHYSRVKASSIDAVQAFQMRSRPVTSKGTLEACAIYFVPPEESDLYRFGSATLGYDVRQEKRIQSRWEDRVGEAASFGFHVTCADVLYFFNQQEIDLIVEELRFLAKEFDPFEILNLNLQADCPDPSSISLAFDDPSGCLEAIHFELVHRVYRKATASNYSLRSARCARDQSTRRMDFMIRRYKAPYILGSYMPHFTLLTNVSQINKEETLRALETEFRRAVPERSLLFERLAVMKCPSPTAPWTIAQEIELGK